MSIGRKPPRLVFIYLLSTLIMVIFSVVGLITGAKLPALIFMLWTIYFSNKFVRAWNGYRR